MLIKKPDDVLPSEITPPELYQRRRRFLRQDAFQKTDHPANFRQLLRPLRRRETPDKVCTPEPKRALWA